MTDNSFINSIILKAISEEELSSAEAVIFEEWLTDEENRKWFEKWSNKDYMLQRLIEAHRVNMDGDKIYFEQKLAIGKRIIIKKRQWKLFRDVATSAAAVLILAAATFYLFKHRKEDNNILPKEKATTVILKDIPPGQTTALLTLADGKTLVLDSTAIGQLAQQGGTVVLNGKGTLKYQPKDASNETLYNTLRTAYGETYSMVLADGSKVWLNAGASIKYPVAFAGNERKVTVTGEVYFEVAKDKSKPFIAHVTGQTGNEMDVQVLGTHFNINAYNDETNIRTTLIEGAVKIRQGSTETLLSPRQQAQVANGVTKVVSDVDVAAITAWKDGYFNFGKNDITVVTRQLAKWYNVEIIYEGDKPTKTFSGGMERNFTLSQSLRALEYTNGVRLRMDVAARKLIVEDPKKAKTKNADSN
jgi:ferric-dicitrate binding protein FerR (iron transport regulator)